MPRIKRWSPISHDFNNDIEVIELRRTYADWMGYVWQEMLHEGDRNGGIVKGTPEQIGAKFAHVSLLKRPSLAAKCITNSLGFMQKCGWIAIQTDRVLILKHLKYHRTEEQKPLPTRPNLTKPDLTKPIKESEPPPAVPVDNYDFRIKEMIGVFYKRDKDLAGEVASWAGRQRNGGNDLGVILLSLERFWQRVEAGHDIGNARGYLTTLEREIWTERKQAEAGNHKHADLSQVGSVLSRMARAK